MINSKPSKFLILGLVGFLISLTIGVDLAKAKVNKEAIEDVATVRHEIVETASAGKEMEEAAEEKAKKVEAEEKAKKAEAEKEAAEEEEMAASEFEDESHWTSIGSCRITTYCAGCNDPAGSYQSSSGVTLYEGCVACSWLPIGTRLRIDGCEYVVMDTCGTDAIDIFVDTSYCQCNANYYTEVYVYE